MVCPQARHTTRAYVPCRSITVWLPALVCSRSTFWVITPVTTPARSSVGQRAVTGVGQRGVHVAPADVVARPVPLPEHGVGGELPDGHRVARRRVRPAVVGDAGVGRQPGSGEHGDALTCEHIDQFGGFHGVQGRRPETIESWTSIPPIGTASCGSPRARTTPRWPTPRPTPNPCCGWRATATTTVSRLRCFPS